MTTSAPATGRELHIDVPLSNVVVGRRPEGFIADRLLPITPVDKQSDIYYKFRYREWFRHEVNITHRAPGTEPKQVAMTVTSDTYYAKNFALAAGWPVEDVVNADAVLQWAESNALFLMDRLMMDYEMRIATLAVNTSNVRTVATISSAWSDPVNSRPLDDLFTWKENFRRATGKRPNTLILPEQVMTFLNRNDQIRDILFGDRGGLATAEQIAAIVGVRQVLVPESLVNTATEMATTLGSGTLSDVWGPHIYFASIDTLQGMMTDTWLNAFRWTSPLFNTPLAVIRHPFDTKKKRYDIEVSYYQDEKVVSSDLALRLMDVVSL
jgi:hypothetical protein